MSDNVLRKWAQKLSRAYTQLKSPIFVNMNSLAVPKTFCGVVRNWVCICRLVTSAMLDAWLVTIVSVKPKQLSCPMNSPHWFRMRSVSSRFLPSIPQHFAICRSSISSFQTCRYSGTMSKQACFVDEDGGSHDKTEYDESLGNMRCKICPVMCRLALRLK